MSVEVESMIGETSSVEEGGDERSAALKEDIDLAMVPETGAVEVIREQGGSGLGEMLTSRIEVEDLNTVREEVATKFQIHEAPSEVTLVLVNIQNKGLGQITPFPENQVNMVTDVQSGD
jgi:hypothetical protein